MFHANRLPEIPVRFEPYLYLTPKHLRTQTGETVYAFYLFRKEERTASAVFQCTEGNKNIWFSPPKAPFGGIQCDLICTSAEISFLLHCVQEWIINHSGKKLVIKQAPWCYNESISAEPDFFKPNGYFLKAIHENHFIKITDRIYAALIHPAERRRLRKCKSAGFVGEMYESADSDIVYAFLESCRSEKGHNISLTINQLKTLLSNFPKEIKVFAVKRRYKIVALTVTILVNRSILYNFLSASLLAYNAYSPAVLLTETVYNFCRDQQISILDLGISLDKNGNEKASLIRFKENIGGVKSYKATYEKAFELLPCKSTGGQH